MLARLLLRPANLIILDEPTNDLDVETLELLESLLTDFEGTLLIVSHDREFIDNTVTSSWWFAGNGAWHEYVGGYNDAVSQGAKFYSEEPEATSVVIPSAPAETKQEKPKKVAAAAPKKLSFKLQRELDQLPAKMEKLEQEVEELQNTVASADFYSQPQDKVNTVLQALATKEQELDTCFERWEELESLK